MKKGTLIIGAEAAGKSYMASQLAGSRKTVKITLRSEEELCASYQFQACDTDTEVVILDEFPVRHLDFIYGLVDRPLFVSKKGVKCFEITPYVIVVCSCNAEDLPKYSGLYRRFHVIQCLAEQSTDVTGKASLLSMDFREWVTDFFHPESGNLDKLITKEDAMKSFVVWSGIQTYTARKFMDCLNYWASHKGYILNPRHLQNNHGRIVARPDGGGLAMELIYMQSANSAKSLKEQLQEEPLQEERRALVKKINAIPVNTPEFAQAGLELKELDKKIRKAKAQDDLVWQQAAVNILAFTTEK